MLYCIMIIVTRIASQFINSFTQSSQVGCNKTTSTCQLPTPHKMIIMLKFMTVEAQAKNFYSPYATKYHKMSRKWALHSHLLVIIWPKTTTAWIHCTCFSGHLLDEARNLLWGQESNSNHDGNHDKLFSNGFHVKKG